MTPESRSKLIAHSIDEQEDGIYRLAGVYRNEPNIGLQGQRSEIHHGAFSLEIYGAPVNRLEGHYWTDRNTRGEMVLSGRKEKIIDTYLDGKAQFRD